MHTAASADHRNANATPGPAAQLWNRLLTPSCPADWRLLESKSLAGRRVMITGAGGSIGSALSHATAASSPASLVLLDNSENGLYLVDRSLHEAGLRKHVSLLGSVCDSGALAHAMALHRPEIIFHAAALKHVPLMERNPFAAIENNVFGTLTVAQAAVAHKVEQVIFVSTDKAVEPHSVMGASKRVAELILLSLAGSTRMKVVRLCNVMGSHGSVLPLFLEQIASGGPVTVTHADAQRHFIPLDDAVQALFDALDVPATRALLLPTVDPAVHILDLARYLIASHKSPAAIEFTGLRPGDKLSERLISSGESLSAEDELGGSGLRAIHSPTPSAEKLGAALEGLRGALSEHDTKALLHAIKGIVPEYEPSRLILEPREREARLELAMELPA